MKFEGFNKAMPRYRSHKCVSAAKITSVLTHIDGIVDLQMITPNKNVIKTRVSKEWGEKHEPDLGGYLVLYDDGYVSYSPAAAFESGYTLLLDNNEGSE